MTFLHRNGAIAALALGSLGALAEGVDDPFSAVERWQINQLMEPSPVQRAAEARGRVTIYDGLDIGQVNAALDRHFDRIQHMMFTRVRVPEPSSDTGYAVENDGCD